MTRSLLMTNDFPPVISGISTLFYNVWKYYSPERMLVLTPRTKDSETFDRAAAFRPVRFRTFAGGKIGKLVSFVLMTFWCTWCVIFRNVREIHTGQILSSGLIGFMFQKLFGIPCFLWVYGGETTKAYRRSLLEEKIIGTLLRECTFLVTISPVVTEEFLEYGIPEERIIEIIPAVDAETFTPGPRPANLVEKLGLEDKQVLLTVSRLTERKGHDLVLKALDILRNHDKLHYVIVGIGEDRERLEGIITKSGLSGRVTFTGRIDDSELPDYYRLCDIYVMPNREVLGSTDSIEGFGISFIEANACEKPVIAGRSGGTSAAVEDGVSGYRVDPENPEELAEKIRHLLDNPDKSADMGRRSRERVLNEFSWEDSARKLAESFSVSAF
ncbi:MAG: glycosyltransferase family 4 protein [Candidatus Latescibacteria bacterium]|jgi:phosphatidyl-myo-inositol dimannoside synthase|nr:glycosyltransferase family 4 protein [Candidatus Latescibacterota bacterium]